MLTAGRTWRRYFRRWRSARDNVLNIAQIAFGQFLLGMSRFVDSNRYQAKGTADVESTSGSRRGGIGRSRASSRIDFKLRPSRESTLEIDSWPAHQYGAFAQLDAIRIRRRVNSFRIAIAMIVTNATTMATGALVCHPGMRR
jgi:hypothetical protein